MASPLEVLREAVNAAYGGDLDAGRVDAEKMLSRYDAALAQVEAWREALIRITDRNPDDPSPAEIARCALGWPSS